MKAGYGVRRLGVGLATGALLLLTGCQAIGSPQALPGGGRVDSQVRGHDVSAEITPKDGQLGVLPTDPIKVTSTDGEVTDVVVVGSVGPSIRGSLADGVWSSEPGQQMIPGAEYGIYALVKDGTGFLHSIQTSFRVLDKAHQLRASVAPLAGETVGVGMPVIVYFSAPVKDKAAVESKMTVTSTPPVEGAWHWFGDTEVHYRPRVYWTPDTDVTVNLDLAGVDAGGGVRALKSRSVSFHVGDAHLSHVDAIKHTMVVTSNGKVLRTFKVSTGRDKYPTSSGIHVVIEKTRLKLMDSATVGIPRKSPDGYYEKVPYSTRISYSGEFVHAASWSVRDQGVRNVSHGCVNLSPSDAQWFFGFSRRGDIVDVTGTTKRYAQGRGFQEWTYTWDQWKAGSALAG